MRPGGIEDDDWDEDNPFGDTVDFPVRDELDLHGLPPKLIPELVASYLEEARKRGFAIVRIVHGKGEGVQRAIVRKVLDRTPFVGEYEDAPADRGGWGATMVRIDE